MKVLLDNYDNVYILQSTLINHHYSGHQNSQKKFQAWGVRFRHLICTPRIQNHLLQVDQVTVVANLVDLICSMNLVNRSFKFLGNFREDSTCGVGNQNYLGKWYFTVTLSPLRRNLADDLCAHSSRKVDMVLYNKKENGD